MPITPENIDALIAAREKERAAAAATVAEKRDVAVQALAAFYEADQRHLADPWDPTRRTAADDARTAYTNARQALRAAVTSASSTVSARVQAKIDELAA